MNMKYLFVSLFLILNPFSANAFTFGDPLTNGEWFKEMGIKNVKIVIQDDIKDGCWTNLKEVREYTEEKLRIIDATSLSLDKNFKFNSINNSMLIQSEDNKIFSKKDFKIVSKKKPTKSQFENLI